MVLKTERKNLLPKPFHHRASGQDCVKLNGKFHYLGKHGSREAQLKYHRLISEWIAAGESVPAGQQIHTIAELIHAWMNHCEKRYRKNGKQTSELNCQNSTM